MTTNQPTKPKKRWYETKDFALLVVITLLVGGAAATAYEMARTDSTSDRLSSRERADIERLSREREDRAARWAAEEAAKAKPPITTRRGEPTVDDLEREEVVRSINSLLDAMNGRARVAVDGSNLIVLDPDEQCSAKVLRDLRKTFDSMEVLGKFTKMTCGTGTLESLDLTSKKKRK